MVAVAAAVAAAAVVVALTTVAVVAAAEHWGTPPTRSRCHAQRGHHQGGARPAQRCGVHVRHCCWDVGTEPEGRAGEQMRADGWPCADPAAAVGRPRHPQTLRQSRLRWP